MEAMMKLEHLSKKREHFTLEDVTFSLPEGYIVGVAGRNGSGKSTLFQILMIGDFGAEGSVTVGGKNWSPEIFENEENELISFRKQCAFVLEDYPFPESISAVDIGRLFGSMYDTFDEKRYCELLKKLEVPEKKPARKLSQGMKIKVQMAFAFSHESRLLVLDEPSANLDTFARKELYDLMYEYMEPGNRTILWATHLTEELDRMADYILFLEKGKQVYFGEKSELVGKYRMVKGSKSQLDCMKSLLIGRTDRDTYSEGMVKTEDGPFRLADTCEEPTMEQLMCYLFPKK